jgi:electron transfer flavoprotein alpha subunit
MILTLIEHDRGRLNDLSLEALTFGRGLAEKLGQPQHAVLIGAEAQPLAERLGAYGAAVVHLAVHDRLTDYAPEAWAQCVLSLVDELKPAAVLATGSDRGAEVLAHLAARAGLPLAANVTEVAPGAPDEPYTVTRLRWGGSLLEDARLYGRVKLFTVAPHAVFGEAMPGSAAPEVRTFTPALAEKDFRVMVTGRIEADRSKVSLAEAPVVVGGGRGVGSAEGFAKLEELARLLGGAVGCSRAVTSLGWRPHLDQIGQTGTRIAPEIYIACGVSGAIQHMVGCKAAKRLLAINTDPDAPIVAKADYAIIGDLHEVVPALSECVRQRRGS